jgi:VanZ family protein
VAAIVWLSVAPTAPTLNIEQGDKLSHLAAYGSLMFWFALLYPGNHVRLRYAAGFIAMGIGLEFVQRALGYRTFDLYDMLANSIGILLGWASALAVPRILSR